MGFLPISCHGLFLFPPKTWENLCFFFSRGIYRPVAWNGLIFKIGLDYIGYIQLKSFIQNKIARDCTILDFWLGSEAPVEYN